MAKLSVFKRSRPPRFVIVLGFKIKIRFVKKLNMHNQELLGLYCPEAREILLLKHDGWREILFHELIHCALDLTGANQGLSEKHEEMIVRALTSGIFPLV